MGIPVLNRDHTIVAVTSLAWAGIAGIAYLAIVASDHGLLGSCETTEVSVHPNPSFELDAVIYKGSCGSTTSIGPAVALRDAIHSQYFDIFIPSVASPLKIEWSDSSTLRISSPSATSDLQVVKRNGVLVEYYDYYFPHDQF